MTNFVTTGKKTTRGWKYQASVLSKTRRVFSEDFVPEYRLVFLDIDSRFLWDSMEANGA